MNWPLTNPVKAGARELKQYRCPACGEMVNNLDREAVRTHHDHVLHPTSAFGSFLRREAGAGRAKATLASASIGPARAARAWASK